MEYHPQLGWIPRPGRFSSHWTSNVDANGIRSNGKSILPARPAILAVGDSFTFGDEVEDGETWPAYLEDLLGKRVLNAGVGAYGIDQAFLRAKLFLDKHDPDLVILSFISDDINRTEYSHYPYAYRRGWKPYFEYVDGSLILRNVPVPQEPAPRSFRTLRHVLGFSVLADAILGRVFPRWWRNMPVIQQMHHDGENVSVELLVRLDGLTKVRGIQLITIALATNGRIGGNTRLPSLVKRARDQGIQVLDLSTEIRKLQVSQLRDLFLPGGHYSPRTNHLVAEHIAAFLRERGIQSSLETVRNRSLLGNQGHAVRLAGDRLHGREQGGDAGNDAGD